MIKMALHLAGYDLRAFLRDRQSQFFTLALPVIFLLIFASVFGTPGSYVPRIIAFGVIAAAFVLMAVVMYGIRFAVIAFRAPPPRRAAEADRLPKTGPRDA